MDPRANAIGCILALTACTAAAPALGKPASEKILYAFGGHADGDLPNSPLLRVGKTLYGTTQGGGIHGYGTIFSVDPSGKHVVLYKFKGGTDGWNPVGGLVEFGGILYGATMFGGTTNNEGQSLGTVFSITPHGAYHQLYQFKGPASDGFGPQSGLVVLGNLLYGTTLNGGTSDDGTVYSITPLGAETPIYSFKNGADGFYPTSLITDGKVLYGTTYLGAGTDCDYDGCGAIFSVDAQGNETTLHSFGNGDDGGNVFYPLLKQGDLLYGGAFLGGRDNLGVIFSLSLKGAYKVLYQFSGDSPALPEGLVNLGGTLYGSSYYGGADGAGMVYTLSKSGALTTIYSFQGGSDGGNPGNLLAASGALYGTTRGAPTNCDKIKPPDCGMVITITP